MSRLRRFAFLCAVMLPLSAALACAPDAGTVPVATRPAPKGCITDVGPADKLVVTGCGPDMSFNVSVPPVCMEKACGLIFDVHGFTMSGDVEEKTTGIAAIGRQEGYIVVQPSALTQSATWQASQYPYIADFIDLAVDVWRVEKRRVHFGGFSLGGMMTQWMQCNKADVLASVAVTSAAGSNPACRNTTDSLYTYGTTDYFFPQEAFTRNTDSVIAVNGLTGPKMLADTPEVQWKSYRNPTGATELQTIVHTYTTGGLKGHCIMGSNDPGSPYGCDQDTTFHYGRIVVDFFKKHPKDPAFLNSPATTAPAA